MADEESVPGNEQGIGACARKGGKGCVYFANRTGVEGHLNLQTDAGGGFLDVP
jgi:hypothetical protein